MATVRTAASAAVTEADPDETEGGGGERACETVHRLMTDRTKFYKRISCRVKNTESDKGHWGG